MKLINAIMT